MNPLEEPPNRRRLIGTKTGQDMKGTEVVSEKLRNLLSTDRATSQSSQCRRTHPDTIPAHRNICMLKCLVDGLKVVDNDPLK